MNGALARPQSACHLSRNDRIAARQVRPQVSVSPGSLPVACDAAPWPRARSFAPEPRLPAPRVDLCPSVSSGPEVITAHTSGYRIIISYSSIKIITLTLSPTTHRITLDRWRPLLMSMDRIVIFDTTLRDGEQSPGCSMDLDEKLRMARQLELLGVDVIEAGFPIASEGDFVAVPAFSPRR